MQHAAAQTLGPRGRLERWWRNWRARDAARQELACCGRDEITHIALDVGVSPSELQTLAGRWPDSASLLERRLDALGLEQIADSEPQVLHDLQRVCGQCTSERRCERDLNVDLPATDWRDHCPNVATL